MQANEIKWGDAYAVMSDNKYLEIIGTKDD